MFADLVFSQTVIRFTAEVADVAVVGPLHMFRFNMASTVGLVSKVLNASDT